MARFLTLNGSVRSYLQDSQRSIHHYSRCAKYASSCLSELLFDRLQIINTVRRPVNEFFEADIPSDCIDKVEVAIQVGQFLRPLVEKDSFNQMANYDTAGEQINYPEAGETDDLWGSLTGSRWRGVNTNSNGENTGGYYGLGAGSEPDTFGWNERRNIIQLNSNISNSFIVLRYISDGTYVNAATEIPVYAKRSIETYIDWQYKVHSKSYGLGDADEAKRLFYREMEKLAARKNNLTPELLLRIMNRNRKASIH